MRRPALLLLSGLLVAGAGAVPAASAAPGAAPSAGGHRPSSTAQHRPDPAALVRRAGRALTPATRGVATGTVAHRVLDPGATALPAGRNGKVQVAVTGDTATVATRVRALGGKVLAHAGSVSSVVIAKSTLSELASATGVTAVRAPIRPHELATTSEGVSASNAQAWHEAADDDADGIAIGIVDTGFSGLAAAETAGDLPSDTVVVNEDCTSNGETSTETGSHGTAVAEIASQMAPGATLHLYCVASNTGFANASSDIRAYDANTANTTKIKIVSSSLGFSDDGRGDGTGASSGDGVSSAFAVQQARRAGILWIQSAGNEAENHWSGTLADADKDGLVDLDGTYNEAKNQYEDDVTYVPGEQDGVPSESDIELQWDQWPATNAAVTLQAYGFQCTGDFQPDGTCGEQPIHTDSKGNPAPTTVKHVAGTDPYAEIDLTNTSQFEQYWVVYVVVGTTAYPSTRYDLTYQGDVDGPSYLACAGVDSEGFCNKIASRSSAGSISAPASSPYALAVGAANVGADGTARGTLEPFSSQGPTIDSRVKPDITAWDGVSSPVYGQSTATEGGFYGTSAAAPHVAGAAALVLAANPSFDASQLQSFLEQRANSGAPLNPPTNALGHGLLTLGATPAAQPVVAPAGSRYAAVTPTRLLDTRTTLGGHHSRVAAGQTVTITVPGLPADATAVAINLTATGAAGSAAVTAYPGGAQPPTTSNLNLTRADPTAAVFATVTLSATDTITVRDGGATVDVVIDEVGYFGTGEESGRYTALATPTRVLDTRTTLGGHNTRLGAGSTVIVHPDAPQGATAAVVNLTAAAVSHSGYFSAAPTCSSTSSSLNYQLYTRANLAVVQLAPNGTFCLSNTTGTADALVDVQGFLGTSGAEYYPLPSPVRIVDTRVGNGGSGNGHASAPIGPAATSVFYGVGVAGVPDNATALLTGVVEASATTSSYLVTFPGATPPSGAASTLNFSRGRIVANASVVGLPASNQSRPHQFGVYNSAGSTQAVVDLFGYFAMSAA